MKRDALIAGFLACLAIIGWRAAISRGQASNKLKTLEEIFLSKNDNDPRLDRDFNDLTSETKSLLRQKYRELPPERRNERGTIVYLLGKNLSSARDWAFMRGVVAEPPCLSLADCSKTGAAGAVGDEVTLAYPALVALKQAQRALAKNRAAQGALGVIAAGKTSPTPAVARLADRIAAR